MKQRIKKVIFPVISAIFVVVAVVMMVFLFQNKTPYVTISVYHTADQYTENIKLKPSDNILDKISNRKVDGYSFVGLFYDMDLENEVEDDAHFSSNRTLVASYQREIVKKSAKEVDVGEDKFVKISTNNCELSSIELKNIANSNVEYLDLSECKIENNTLESFIFLNSKLKKVILPNTLERIENGAFKNSFELKEIVFGENITSIGDQAFYNCKNLSDITLPKKLNTLGSQVFAYCSADYIYIDSNLTAIEKDTFEKFSAKQIDVNSENVLYSVKNGVLYSSNFQKVVFAESGLRDVILDERASVIESYAFEDSAIESVSFSGEVKDISSYAFYNAKNLKTINLVDSVSYSIGEKAFYNCLSLENIEFTLGIKNIENSAFENCKNLKSVIIKSSNVPIISNIQKIGNYAFRNCESLASFNIPDTVTELGESAFYNCKNMQNVTLSARLNRILDKTFYLCTKLENIAVNGNIMSIGNYSFCNCESLENISTLQNINSMGVGAFMNCKSLISANLKNITNLPDYAFYNCEEMVDANLENLISIGKSAFYNCKGLSTFVISSSLQSFEEGCFSKSGISRFVGESTNYIAEDGVLYNSSKNAIICYPNMKNDTNFTIKANILNILDKDFYTNQYISYIDVEAGNSSFSAINGVLFNADKTKLIRFPNDNSKSVLVSSPTEICNYAFAYNPTITSLTINGNVNIIDKGAFNGLTNIASLNLPFVGKNSTEEKFLGYAFGASSYQENADKVPASLKTVILTSETKLYQYSFFYCTNLENLQLNAEVEEIGEFSLYNAVSLKNIAFEGAIKTIKDYSLYSLNSLQSLSFSYREDLVLEENSVDVGSNVVYVSVARNHQSVVSSKMMQLRQKFVDVCELTKKWVFNLVEEAKML